MNIYQELDCKRRYDYKEIICSPILSELSVYSRKGINNVVAGKDDKDVYELCGSFDGENVKRCMRKFCVPFKMKINMDECVKCGNKMEYIGGIKQYLDRYAYFENPSGWIETKNQYMCSKCCNYFVHIEREYIFTHNGRYVLHVLPFSGDISKLRYKETTGMKIAYEMFEEQPIFWEGICFMCGEQTQCYNKKSRCCVTGKSSQYYECVCERCEMMYYAEEHCD